MVLSYSGQSSIININDIKNINGRNKATSITYYDVSTLCTNILHRKYIRILNDHVDLCFRGDGGEVIVVDRYGAQWSNRQQAGAVSFTKYSLKKAAK